jgi:hypothetical protein
MEVDRRAFIASLGGVAAVSLMDHEAKAEALEHYMEEKLDAMVRPLRNSDRRRDRGADRNPPFRAARARSPAGQ